MAFPKFINRWIKKCEGRVGIIPIFAGLIAFAFTMFWHLYFFAPFAAVGVFAIVGLADIFHVNRKTQLVERRKPSYKADFYLSISDAHPLWQIKVLKEFSHGQARFKVMGFEQKPIPFGISEPLCPRCGLKIIERITVFFPGIIRIKWLCNCGFEKSSNQTLAEVKREAARIGNIPVENT